MLLDDALRRGQGRSRCIFRKVEDESGENRSSVRGLRKKVSPWSWNPTRTVSSWKPPGGRRRQTHLSNGGGKTRTATFVGKDGDGHPVHNVVSYDKQ